MASEAEEDLSGRHNGFHIRYRDADCGYAHSGDCSVSCNWDNPLKDGFEHEPHWSEADERLLHSPRKKKGEYPDPEASDESFPYGAGTKQTQFRSAQSIHDEQRQGISRSNSLGSSQLFDSRNIEKVKAKNIQYPPSKRPEQRSHDDQPQLTPPETQKRKLPKGSDVRRTQTSAPPKQRKQASNPHNDTRIQRLDDELTPAQIQQMAMKESERLRREEDEGEEDVEEPPVLGKRAKNMIQKAHQYGVTQVDVGTLNMLDREARKLFLMTLGHGDDATMSKHIVNAVPLLPELDPRYKLKETHGWYRDTLMGKAKGFKSDLMTAFLRHTETCREISQADGTGILHLATKVDKAEVLQIFRTRFDADNFREVFVFARGFVDLERSHGFGAHYLREVYANGCYQTLMFLNCQANAHRLFHADMVLWAHVSEYICAIPSTSAFAGKLQSKHFEWLEDQLPYNKRTKKPRVSPNVEAPEVQEYEGDI